MVGASSPLVADLVKNIGGKRVEILLFPNWQKAKAFFWMGKDLEPKVYDSLLKIKDIPQEVLLGFIPRIDGNPYEYFDALAVKSFIYRVSKVLKLLDLAGEGYYQRNLSRYSVAIEGTFREGKWSMARFKEKTVYTLSPHFSYLLKGLGLKEVRVSLENLSSVKGILIDDPKNPLKEPVPKGVILVRLLADLSGEVNTYLGLIKENIVALSLAFSQLM
ncbi:MAG: metal ABC transporter substrate-binding protein [Synergistetes bacterium]|nr:metal ABC transporter substrate-binding protein [Synergistota bacterium]